LYVLDLLFCCSMDTMARMHRPFFVFISPLK
jgi:hypothetical protein